VLMMMSLELAWRILGNRNGPLLRKDPGKFLLQRNRGVHELGARA
jgi:hypothetical protein